MGPAPLELDAVTKRFGSFTAVRNLSMSVPKGSIVGFLGPNGAGKSTILDVGITYPLIDTYVNNKSTEERGFAANKYGAKKDKDYNAIIRTKSLDYTYKSITFGTFGAFGSGTWDVIERACDPRTHPDATGDYDPWRRPAPKRDFILSLGFALQRANVRMLRGSSLRRRRNRAKDCFASGSRSQ